MTATNSGWRSHRQPAIFITDYLIATWDGCRSALSDGCYWRGKQPPPVIDLIAPLPCYSAGFVQPVQWWKS